MLECVRHVVHRRGPARELPGLGPQPELVLGQPPDREIGGLAGPAGLQPVALGDDGVGLGEDAVTRLPGGSGGPPDRLRVPGEHAPGQVVDVGKPEEQEKAHRCGPAPSAAPIAVSPSATATSCSP